MLAAFLAYAALYCARASLSFLSDRWFAAKPTAVLNDYLLIHSGGGWISAVGSCPTSFRPLPVKRLMARTDMS
jgi:hypothetical protein